MKAPDKIYLQTCGECHGLECDTCRFEELGEVSWCEDRIYETDKEYIRKDALLDFMKKKVNEIEIAMETGADDPVLWGQRNAFKQVIDKLNSM